MDHSDVVIVGGGIIGAFSAYELAKTSESVVVVDPRPGAGASAGNAGMLVPSYCLPMSNPGTVASAVASLMSGHPAVSFGRPLSMATLRWLVRFVVESRPGRALNATPGLLQMAVRSVGAYERLARDGKIDLTVRRCGWLHVGETDSALRTHLKAVDKLRAFGVRADTLTGAEARDIEPRLGPGVVGGVRFADDASVDPAAACAAVLAAAQHRGARVVLESAVGIVQRRGRVVAVRTNSSEIPCSAVVLAVGGQTAGVARRFGVRTPGIEPGQGWSLTVSDPAPEPLMPLMSIEDHVVLNAWSSTTRITGGMRFGGDPSQAPPAEAFDRLRATAERLVPDLATVTADDQRWWDARPMTASGVPVTARCLDNLVVATGHGTLGMTLAPATAQLVVDQLNHLQTRSVL